MKQALISSIALLLFSFSIPASPSAVLADEANDAGQHLPSPEKEIVKVTDHGLVPSILTLHKLDSSVFFVNTTKDSLVTVAIDFGSHEGHCASANLKFENGSMHSIEPIGPKDFAITCFPQSGTYDIKVDGVGGKQIVGKVIVP